MRCQWCLVLGIFVAASTGCLEQQEPDIGSANAPILGGVSASAGEYPTVVAVENRGLCTGTLISSDLVLTAAHCLSPSVLGYSSQQAVTDGTSVVLDTSNVFSGEGSSVGASATIPHPSFNVSALGDNDIGLIRLATPVTDRDPTPINRVFNDAPPGVVVTQVGYGMSEVGNQSSAGRLFVLDDKQSIGCASVGGSDSNLLCFSQSDGSGKCEGDSGGPSFATLGGVQRVVGVTSFGDQNCTQFGADTRVDGELDFLFGQAPELQCQPDGICNDSCGGGGLPNDPDCVMACEVDDDCDDPGNQQCIDGECHPRPLSPGGLGSECDSAADCDSGLCATGPDGGRCTDLCTDGNDCPDDFECTAAGDTNVCWEAEGGGSGGGCQVGGREHGAGSLLLLGVFIALARRRRRSNGARQ